MKVITHPQAEPYAKVLENFLENPPDDPLSFQRAKKNVENQQYDRKALVDVLRNYNQIIGDDEVTLANIDQLLKNDTFCVVTGQQLGFMGGPLYTILKGISTLLLAKSIGAVPVFWLATEDHDVTEIDHADVLDSYGNLKRFHLQFPKRNYFVEDLVFTEKNREVFQVFVAEMEMPAIFSLNTGDSYAFSMAKLLKYLFRNTGMVFIEPRFLRSLAKEFFLRELRFADEIKALLENSLANIEKQGFKLPIHLKGTTNLFYKNDEGKRCKVELSDLSEKKWFTRIENQPETMSGNVIGRIVMQNLLFPTVAYLAGPTEMQYHSFLKEYHHFHGIGMPWIFPRISATVIPPMGAEFLKKCHIEPWDPLPNHLHQAGNLPTYALHFLHQLLHPKKKKQERVLNWWWFQKNYQGNLLQDMLVTLDWKNREHHYLWI